MAPSRSAPIHAHRLGTALVEGAVQRRAVPLHPTRRRDAIALLAGTLAAPWAVAQAGVWPMRPLRVIVPLPAGSGVDTVARIVLRKVGQNLGQAVVVENQPGAAGLTGAGNVARAAPDGYTFGGFNDSLMTMLPHLTRNMPWDIVHDFAPVSLVATVDWCLVVNADGPHRALADLVAAAKREPGKVTYGSGGNGSPQHIAMALFATQAGVQLQHVPYKGATQAAVGLASGEVHCCAQGVSTVASLVRAGKLRLLAVTTPRRLPQFPDVETAAEAGLPGFEFNSWFALLAPAGTPRTAVAMLASEIRKALADPEVRDKLLAQGLTPRGLGPEELGSATRTQLARHGELIRRHGISAD